MTTRAIRFYEDEGLLAPQRNGRSRIYGERERVRIKLVVRGKRLGLRVAITDVLPWNNGHPQADAAIARLNRLIDRIGNDERVPGAEASRGAESRVATPARP